MTLLVILIVAVLASIFESGAGAGAMHTSGQDLWWTVATATTVGSQLYPATAAGQGLAFLLRV